MWNGSTLRAALWPVALAAVLGLAACQAAGQLGIGGGPKPGGGPSTAPGHGAGRPDPSPIRHVVVLYMENHSFDNVLGRLCHATHRCDGAIRGRLPSDRRISLPRANDLIPNIPHNRTAQMRAMAHGAMDGFGRIGGCSAQRDRACYQQFRPWQIPASGARCPRRHGRG